MSFNPYHIIPTFNDPKEEAFGKHCGKRGKLWLPAFSPFTTRFSTVSKRELIILATFKLTSANAFNLDQSKILLFDRVNSLPNDKFLNWSKLKAFADDKSNGMKN